MDVATQNERGLQYEPEVNYHRAWAAYSRRHHTAILLLFSWPVVALGLIALSSFWINQPALSLAIIVVWLLLALAAVWWAGEFRCPRCRRRYAALGHKRGTTNLTRGLFDQVCSNCKLKKFEFGERRSQATTRPVSRKPVPITEQPVPSAPAIPLESNEPVVESNMQTVAPEPVEAVIQPVDVAPETQVAEVENPVIPSPPHEPHPAAQTRATGESGTERDAIIVPVKAVGVKSKSSAKRKPRKASQ